MQYSRYIAFMAKKRTGTQKNIRFSDEEVKFMDSMRKKGMTYSEIVSAGLKALESQSLTKAQVIAYLNDKLDD